MELFLFYFVEIMFIIWACITFIVLLFKPANYGRHSISGINYKIAWPIMESVPIFSYLIYYFIGNRIFNIVSFMFMVLFVGHYINRAFIFPFLTRGKEVIPLNILSFGIFFNLINGYLQGRWLTYLGPILNINWFLTPQFIIGIIIFFTGMGINLHSDHILRNLRKPGETEYKIPYGGIFKWVSCGNYFGEVIEWIGWAILTWSISGLAFAIWVMANLVPRARSHHKWYLEKFPNYPKNRKAIIPFVF
ncbi:MAG: DUF1295 domain-containing protein [Candidatus Helarchaeota archaeon]